MDLLRIKRTVEIRVEAGRRISGIVMPYGEVSPSHRERFVEDSIHWGRDLTLNILHLDALKVATGGAGLELRNEQGHLTLAADLPDTPTGRAAHELVRGGVLTNFSVEFVAEAEHREDGIRVVDQAELVGIGLVDRPSYHGATAEARSEQKRKAKKWL